MRKITFLFLIVFISFSSTKAVAQSEPFIGQISMFAGNFAPRGWAFCDGQLLAISQNTALFSILGTTYGGDGRTTFGLPDLRGRVPMHPGTGFGLSRRSLGESGGSETNTLNISQMPSHSHTVNAVSTDGNTNDPTNAVPANTKVLDKEYSTAATDAVIMKSTMISPAGGNSSINNMQPYKAINFIIALQGIFPSRS
ncbi:phage tail protein [Flavobacterium sp. 7A]|uniref:phage tail protein n=1 Tax=Flavobacterium sp. 7A TaxID=2940571 RepID=UPI0029CAB64E|nr:tail fiber protein [Flavobacterium sp. 7A]MCW2118610.1 microcystin-dependent protein [Flavobacterium sp. 7A]